MASHRPLTLVPVAFLLVLAVIPPPAAAVDDTACTTSDGGECTFTCVPGTWIFVDVESTGAASAYCGGAPIATCMEPGVPPQDCPVQVHYTGTATDGRCLAHTPHTRATCGSSIAGVLIGIER